MALFDGLVQRAAERVQERAGAIGAGAEAALAEFPDIRVRRDGEALVIEAIGLLRRWIGDARLRFALRSER